MSMRRRGETGEAKNIMTLNESMAKQLAGMKRLWDKEPFRIPLGLVSRALTVYHEYTHMDQDNPKWEPKYGDPAWQATDKAITRWYNHLEKEYENLKNELSNQEKLAKLQELSQLLQQIAEQKGPMEEGIASNVKDKALSPNLTWEYPDTCTKAAQLANEIKEEINKLEKKPSPQQSAMPDHNVWKLVNTMIYSENLPEGFRELENPTKITRKLYGKRMVINGTVMDLLYGIPQASVSDGICAYKYIISTSSPDSKDFYEDKNIVYQATVDFKWTQLPIYLKPGDKLKCSFSWKEEKADQRQDLQFDVESHYWEKFKTSVVPVNSDNFYYLEDPLKVGLGTLKIIYIYEFVDQENKESLKNRIDRIAKVL
jgi:hypothetical protein